MPAQALLLAPPRAPLFLPASGEVVMGRGQSCDLPLPSGEASRRHAAIRAGENHYTLRDLGSTNGTFVNGEPIAGERSLEPGDRIQIGDAVVIFCLVDPALAEAAQPSDNCQTIIVERAPALSAPVALSAPAAPSTPAALEGSIEQIPTFALLQMLELGAQSGCLEVESDDGPYRVWLQNGRPVHAEGPKTAGFEAAKLLIGLERGRFQFEAKPPPSECTLEASVTELLLESCRLFDEGE
jgi:pSer/pThr/pTyr-binding forkhead associated (FHA) protein